MKLISPGLKALFLAAPVVVTIAGCSSSTTVATGPSPVTCEVALTPPAALDAGVGVGSVNVATTAGCAWTATENATWITGLTPSSGQGNGVVQFQLSANPALSIRQADIAINGVVARVTQFGTACAVELSPTSRTIPASGGLGTVAVTTPSGCPWTAATSGESWLAVTSGVSGTTSGTVRFAVAANAGVARVGTILIGGQAFVVTQPAPACSFVINPASQSAPTGGGAGAPIAVTADAACAWTATTSDTWISITSGASGTGNGTVEFTAAANAGPLRTGAISISGQTHTVTQASGCVYSISPTSQSFSNAAATSAPIAVTTTSGCAWTATSNDPWITVTTGANGTGEGTVRFSITGNGTGSIRTGTLTIAGRTFTVSQND